MLSQPMKITVTNRSIRATNQRTVAFPLVSYSCVLKHWSHNVIFRKHTFAQTEESSLGAFWIAKDAMFFSCGQRSV